MLDVEKPNVILEGRVRDARSSTSLADLPAATRWHESWFWPTDHLAMVHWFFYDSNPHGARWTTGVAAVCPTCNLWPGHGTNRLPCLEDDCLVLEPALRLPNMYDEACRDSGIVADWLDLRGTAPLTATLHAAQLAAEAQAWSDRRVQALDGLL